MKHLEDREQIALITWVRLMQTKHPELATEQDLLKAFSGVDAVVLATEWQEYRQLEPSTIEGLKKKFIIDGRNVLDYKKWQKAGFKVLALGKTITN